MSDREKLDTRLRWFPEIDEHSWLQIDAAARGCVSGTLEEWPHLDAALIKMLIFLHPETQAITLQRICRLLVGVRSSEECLDRCRNMAETIVSGKDQFGTPIRRSWYTSTLNDIITECRVPQTSGHRCYEPRSLNCE